MRIASRFLKKHATVSVQLPEAVADALYAFAADQGNSMASVIRTAVRQYLEKHNALPKEPEPDDQTAS
jgi:metal-responsive CopG/Arc/MetJ family transcriptional regulator